MATRSSYNEVKQFNGKRYTGMQVGRSHKWRYDAGEWKERKVTPDRWEFTYKVVKRRAGRAPEGSGAPIGTAYHWYIVANQVVTKLDANSYTTEMVGHKLKVAHRRADHATWNASERAKNKQLVKLLRELADELEAKPVEPEPPSEAAVTAHARERKSPRTSATHTTRRTSRTGRTARRARPATHRTPRATSRRAAQR